MRQMVFFLLAVTAIIGLSLIAGLAVGKLLAYFEASDFSRGLWVGIAGALVSYNCGPRIFNLFSRMANK